MFKGSIPALITPMRDDGSLDIETFERFVNWQIEEGSFAIAPAGTTGESPTLDHEEHRLIVREAVRIAAGRVPVIAGAGSNSTKEALCMAQYAKDVGASAVLVVTPYYNKPTQDGLYRHYMTLADSVDIPIIVYNIPGRSVIDMSVETLAKLAQHPNIVGVKDATANLLRPLQTAHAITSETFCQLSGEDGTAVAFLASGGHGCISVTANIAPRLCADMHRAWQEGRHEEAMAIHKRLFPLHDALFCESNPAPVKYAAQLLGVAGGTCRLPLAPLTAPSRDRVEKALRQSGLLS